MAWRNDQLDERIEEITVDAYGEYEQMGSFACVIEEILHPPVLATLAGVEVEVIAVEDAVGLGGLRARCRQGGEVHSVSLADIAVAAEVDHELALTLAAYRRWLEGGG